MMRVQILIICIVLIVFDNSEAVFSRGSRKLKAISIFQDKDAKLHKYSAILAASEPFLSERNEDIRKILNPVMYMYHRVIGTTFNDPDSNLRRNNKNVDIVCSKYERRTGEIVKSYGLTMSTFNSLSEKIQSIPELKKKVLLQAHFYKIAADLEANLKPVLPTLPEISELESTSLDYDDFSDFSSFSSDKETYTRPRESEFHRFCKALNAVENERLRMREKLQGDLNVDNLPISMCEPSTLPVMAKSVQRACLNFPPIASSVVRQYDLDMDRFEQLKRKMKRNLLFGLKVNRELYKDSDRNNRTNKLLVDNSNEDNEAENVEA